MKYYFDERSGERICNFIERYIVHTEGVMAGKPFILEAWQSEIIMDLFGWKREDGTRKYRKAYIQIGRGNGKSTMIAALCNACLFVDNEQAAQIYYAALNQRQANDVGFKMVTEQIRANKKLYDMSKILNNAKSVEYRPIGNGFAGLSVFKTVSRDSKSLHGLNAHVAILDEYHTHPTSDVLDTLATSMLKRNQPMLIIITTPGFNMDGPCYKEYNYAKAIIEGKIQDESYYAKIFESSADDDIASEETWLKANPNYGISVHRDYFLQELNKIKNDPGYENTFRVLHLGQWVNSESAWISDIDWAKAYHDGGGYDDLKGCDAFLAFDLSQTSDMTALTVIVPKDGIYYSLNWFWLPRERHQGSAHYKNESFTSWVADGYIELCETRAVDYRVIFDKIMEISDHFNVVNIQYDSYNAAQISADLERDGFEMKVFRQGFLSMSFPTKKMYEFIMTGKYSHGRNPVLRWMAGNATVKYDEMANQKIIKDARFPHKKVDGIITNIMGIGAALQYEYENNNVSYMDNEQTIWEI